MKSVLNLVGPQVRKLRYGRGLTQEQLAAQVGVLGWDISRATLAQIESQVRRVNDGELLFLATALDVELTLLFASLKPVRK